jgi:hypothetical protein
MELWNLKKNIVAWYLPCSEFSSKFGGNLQFPLKDIEDTHTHTKCISVVNTSSSFEAV